MEDLNNRVAIGEMYKTIRISDIGVFQKTIVESNSVIDKINSNYNNYYPINYDLEARITEIENILNKPLTNTLNKSLGNKLNDFLMKSYSTQGFSVRLLNCLKSAQDRYPKYLAKKLEVIGDIFLFDKSEILKFRNFGKITMKEIQKWIENINKEYNSNLKLGMTQEEIKRAILNPINK